MCENNFGLGAGIGLQFGRVKTDIWSYNSDCGISVHLSVCL